ncbi:DUF5678 domain-containing protein [Gemmata sp.]|uniref:DUF5678 domain-containing protein n=1 Tax=Gemmata sp. TaxID=1914242 RepID=UPI003F6F1352
MTPVPIFEAPLLGLPQPRTKWDAEYEAVLRLLPELLKTHRDQYVAVHEGRVVGSGTDKLAVAQEAYKTFGYVEILVRLVTDKPPRVVNILSPHVDRSGGGM